MKEGKKKTKTNLHNLPWKGNWYQVHSLLSEIAQWDHRTDHEYHHTPSPDTSPVERSTPQPESPSPDRRASSPPLQATAYTPSDARSDGPDPRETASFLLYTLRFHRSISISRFRFQGRARQSPRMTTDRTRPSHYWSNRKI